MHPQTEPTMLIHGAAVIFPSFSSSSFHFFACLLHIPRRTTNPTQTRKPIVGSSNYCPISNEQQANAAGNFLGFHMSLMCRVASNLNLLFVAIHLFHLPIFSHFSWACSKIFFSRYNTIFCKFLCQPCPRPK